MTIHHTPTRTINNTGGYRQCKRVRHNGTNNVSAQRINRESNFHRVDVRREFSAQRTNRELNLEQVDACCKFNPYYLRLHAARPTR